jgi:triosephosphate isomerase
MVGHAERRRYFGETDVDVARKTAAVVAHGMVPLICIGEKTKGDISMCIDEVAVQVNAVLDKLPLSAEILLAYEPVWAIGAAEAAQADHVLAVVHGIRSLECVKSREDGKTRILYGGSAGPGIFEGLKDQVDGLFLGRFAHDPNMFYKTMLEISEA